MVLDELILQYQGVKLRLSYDPTHPDRRCRGNVLSGWSLPGFFFSRKVLFQAISEIYRFADIEILSVSAVKKIHSRAFGRNCDRCAGMRNMACHQYRIPLRFALTQRTFLFSSILKRPLYPGN